MRQVRLLKKLAALFFLQGFLTDVFNGVVNADVLGAFVQLAGLFDGQIHGLRSLNRVESDGLKCDAALWRCGFISAE